MESGVELLERAISALASEETTDLATLLRIQTARARLDAESSRHTLIADRAGEYRQDLDVALSTWLQRNAGCSRATARRQVKRARVLDQMPHFKSAWANGTITTDHVVVIETVAVRGVVPPEFAEYEPTALQLAESGYPEDLARAIQQWRIALDDAHQNDGDTLAQRRYERRGLDLSKNFDGNGWFQGNLATTEADLFQRALDKEYERLHAERDDRTPSQQRADALMGIVRHYLNERPATGAREPHVLVLVDLPTYIGLASGRCHTIDGTPIDRDTMLRHACAGSVQALFTDQDGVPLSMGRSVRTFNRQQRRAIIARDGGCRFPGCTQPPTRCETHHVTPYAAPGLGNTDVSNGILLCWHHHHRLHEGRWRVELDPDGTCHFFRPGWIIASCTSPHPPPGKPRRTRPRAQPPWTERRAS